MTDSPQHQPGPPQGSPYGSPQDPTPPPAQTSSTSARTFTIIGGVLGVIAIFFFPIVFGPVGIALALVGYFQGDKPVGLYVAIGVAAATVLGFVLGAIVLNSMM